MTSTLSVKATLFQQLGAQKTNIAQVCRGTQHQGTEILVVVEKVFRGVRQASQVLFTSAQLVANQRQW